MIRKEIDKLFIRSYKFLILVTIIYYLLIFFTTIMTMIMMEYNGLWLMIECFLTVWLTYEYTSMRNSKIYFLASFRSLSISCRHRKRFMVTSLFYAVSNFPQSYHSHSCSTGVTIQDFWASNVGTRIFSHLKWQIKIGLGIIITELNSLIVQYLHYLKS